MIYLEVNGPEIVVLEKLLRIGKILFSEGYIPDRVIQVTAELDPQIGLKITEQLYNKVTHELKHGDRS